MLKQTFNRFAATGADGRILALVADGAVEFPENGDLSGVEDPQLGELYSSISARFEELAQDPNGDLDEMELLSGRMSAILARVAERFSETGEPGGDGGEGEGGEGADAPGDGGEDGEAAGEGQGGAEGGEGAGDPAAPAATDERARRIAAMRTRSAGGPTIDPGPAQVVGITREELADGIRMAAQTAAVAAAEAAAAAVVAVRSEPSPAGARATAADLGGFRDGSQAPAGIPGVQTRPRLGAELLSSADIPNVAMGQPITTIEQLRDAMMSRHRTLGRSTGVNDEDVPVASLSVTVPAERDLRHLDWGEARRKVRSVVGEGAPGVDPFTGREAPIGRGGVAAQTLAPLTASGGLGAPVEPYYPQLVIAQGARPFRDAVPTFAAERGGIKLVQPASIATLQAATVPGYFTDGVTTSGSANMDSNDANFVAADVGSPVVGAGIPANTTILSVTDENTIVLSANATASATGVAFYVRNRNPQNLGGPVGLVSAAQDAAGPPNTVKLTYDVPLGNQAEFDVYSVYTSLQFANLTARTFPEQVEANIKLADALAARVAETQFMDVVTAWSTLLTGAKTFGTARQLLAQLGHIAAFYRNSERMDPRAILRVGLPAWAVDNMRADYLSTFIGGGAANWGLSDEEIIGFFRDHALLPFLYQDGPSDISQLFATTAIAAATNTGTNSASPTAIPDYPGTGATTSFRTKVVSFMWAEGTWLGLTTGELNLGLVRDSILNAGNRFRNFQEEFETPAFVGVRSIRSVHTVAADGTYGAAASITLGTGSGL